jgi:hypothetical protein
MARNMKMELLTFSLTLYQSKNCGHRIHVLFMMYDVYWYCQMKKNEWLWKFWKRGEEETKSMPHAPVVRRHFHSPCPRYTNLWVVLPILDVHCCWVLILYFSGCQNTLPFTLPKIHKSMSCYLSETCTAIDCCIDVEQISRSVNVYINLDACNYRLIAGIEKLTFDIPLLHYQFGQKKSFRLMNIFRIEWVINKNYIIIVDWEWDKWII